MSRHSPQCQRALHEIPIPSRGAARGGKQEPPHSPPLGLPRASPPRVDVRASGVAGGGRGADMPASVCSPAALRREDAGTAPGEEAGMFPFDICSTRDAKNVSCVARLLCDAANSSNLFSSIFLSRRSSSRFSSTRLDVADASSIFLSATSSSVGNGAGFCFIIPAIASVACLSEVVDTPPLATLGDAAPRPLAPPRTLEYLPPRPLPRPVGPPRALSLPPVDC